MLALHRYRGLAFIALWQTAPVVVHQDSAGRVQIHFAAGGGRYEEVSTSCDGDVLGTEDFGYTAGGIAIEAWPADWARLNAFGHLTDSESPGFSEKHLGAFGALEWRLIGLGAGMAVEPHTVTETQFESTDVFPLIYLRAGDIDRYHVRLETTSPRAVGDMGGVVRLGLAYNQGLVRGPRVFGGIAACHGECNVDGETAVGFLDLTLPVSDGFDVQGGVVAGAGRDTPEFGFTLGGTWHFRPIVARAPPVVPAPAIAQPAADEP